MALSTLTSSPLARLAFELRTLTAAIPRVIPPRPHRHQHRYGVPRILARSLTASERGPQLYLWESKRNVASGSQRKNKVALQTL